ncbi:MAG: prepilin peptidase [Acidimicrobiales bacterium]
MTNAQLVLVVAAIVIAFPVGSFTNVIIDRLPLPFDEPNKFGELYGTRPWAEVLGGRSRCSSCGEPVRPVDNIPIVSWLLLKGKCRACGERIPAFHLVVEAAVPGLVALCMWVAGISAQLPMLFWLIPFGVAVAVIDARTLIVPTKLVWPAFAVSIVIAVVVALTHDHPRWLLGGLVGLATLAGPLFLAWFAHPRGMGFGDVRLSAVLGWHVGFAAAVAGGTLTASAFMALICMVLASFSGIVYGLAAVGMARHLPFGPSLVAGAIATCAIAERFL